MAVVTTTPGVYIEEFTPGAPIRGVSTSVAAFVGVARTGDVRTPVKLTAWEQFGTTFGGPVPGRFLWHAVRGFFENGGQVCYVVRASNGTPASRIQLGAGVVDGLPNRAGQPSIRVRARSLAVANGSITVAVTSTALVPATTRLYKPSASAIVTSLRTLLVRAAAPGSTAEQQAAQFRPGDELALGAGGATVQIRQVAGDEIRVSDDLVGPVNAAVTLRLVSPTAQTRTVRLEPAGALPAGALVPGTVLTLTQPPAGGGAATSVTLVVETAQAEPLQLAQPITTYRVTFRTELGTAFNISGAGMVGVRSEEFTLALTQGATTSFVNLSTEPEHPRYYADVLAAAGPGVPVIVEPVDPGPQALLPDSLPGAVSGALVGGTVETPATIGYQEYVDALDTLAAVDDVSLVAVPDSQSTAVQRAVIDHCELLGDRFGVLDSSAGAGPFGPGSVEEQRRRVDSTRGYAGLYYPWLRVPSAALGPPVSVPPSGHVCGIMARSDLVRGVHKAPANEIVRGSVGVVRPLSSVDQGQLNPIGVNVIRVFAAGGPPVLWGARTSATDRNWQYVNIRRLFLHLEESIQEGIQWAVFEPHDVALWQKLRRTITEFLTRAWRDGALFGRTAEEAFYVIVDERLNPFPERALGRLTVEIGVSPTYPAEFIVVRIGIWPGGSEISE